MHFSVFLDNRHHRSGEADPKAFRSMTRGGLLGTRGPESIGQGLEIRLRLDVACNMFHSLRNTVAGVPGTILVTIKARLGLEGFVKRGESKFGGASVGSCVATAQSMVAGRNG